MARPRKVIDPAKIEALAAISCPTDEIAVALGVNERTIERRFAAAVKRGHVKCKERVRSLLFKQALNGNTAAAIFLAKAVCGMREQPDTVINVAATATGGTIQFSEESRKQLVDLAAEIRTRSFQRSQPNQNLVPSGNGNATALN